MPSKVRLKFLEFFFIILGPKTAILGPQFCRILVLGPHFWWSGGIRICDVIIITNVNSAKVWHGKYCFFS